MKKMFLYSAVFVLFFLVLFSNFHFKQEKQTNDSFLTTTKMANLTMPFIENKGQVNDDIEFYAPVFGGVVWINNFGELNYAFTNGDEKKQVRFKESFVDGGATKIRGQNKKNTSVNHFIGADKHQWQSEIPTYRNLALGQVYDGIFVNLQSHANNVEKLFVVQPGADPDRIRIRVEGCASLQIVNNELVAEADNGAITFTKPVAYQEIDGEQRSVEVAYEIMSEANTYGFSLGEYNRDKALVIDPLISSTFLGGSGIDGMNYTNTQIAVNDAGEVYVAGCTQSVNFPVRTGAFSDSYIAGTDGFIAKFNGDLTQLKNVTFFGGNEYDEVTDIQILADGSLYVSGNTESTDLPTTEGAYQREYKGGAFNYYGSGDAFIAHFDGELTTLVASTYVGGSRAEYCVSVAVDNNGDVFFAGASTSDDYPVTSGAYSQVYIGGGNLGEDVIVSKLSGDLTTLLASTYVGGNADDLAEELALDPSGNVFIAGWTASSNYPTTGNAYDRTFGAGLYDAFVTKLDNQLSALKSSSYLGGSDWDFGYGLTLDSECNVYVTGHTASTNFPTSESAFDRDYNGAAGRDVGDDVFISKLDSTLGTLLASTYLGGEGWEIGYAMIADEDGNFYISGTTNSEEFPTVAGAYDSTFGGGPKYGGDVFISRFDQNLTNLSGSTYLGGSQSEGLGGICLSYDGDVYVAGSTGSEDFPVSNSAYNKNYNGAEGDVFVARLDSLLSIDPVTAGFNAEPKTGHMPLTVQFTDETLSIDPITSWQWDFDNDGTTDSNEKNPSWTYEQPGKYAVKLITSDGVNSDVIEMENYIDVFDGESALCFDGANSSVICPAVIGLNLTETMTIEAKIKTTGWGEVAGIGFGRVVDKKNVQLYVVGDHPAFNDNSLVLQLTHSDGSISVSASETNSIALGSWQHIAVSYNATLNEVKIFINGIEQTLFQTRAPSGTIKDNSADDLVIGSNAGKNYTFDGVIDELRIWNSIRTKEEIQQNINSYLNGDESALAAYWKMNEGNGEQISDNSGNGNDAEISGAIWIQGPDLNLPTEVNTFHSNEAVAKDYKLYDNFPNPFNPETTIRFDLPDDSNVTVKIYNITGAIVRTLLNTREVAGNHSIVWDGKNDVGRDVSSGVYLCKMTAKHFQSTKKMLLVR